MLVEMNKVIHELMRAGFSEKQATAIVDAIVSMIEIKNAPPAAAAMTTNSRELDELREQLSRCHASYRRLKSGVVYALSLLLGVAAAVVISHG